MRPLAGFGAPTAIRVSVGTPEELDEFAARARPRARACVTADAAAAACRRRRAAVFGNGMFRLLFLATLGSGVGNMDRATIALTADIVRARTRPGG